MPSVLGPKFNYLDVLFLRLDEHPGAPAAFGDSGSMCIGFGRDKDLFISQSVPQTLFTGLTDSNGKAFYVYRGQYQATRVADLSLDAWKTLPEKVSQISLQNIHIDYSQCVYFEVKSD